jgi:hypothetical protein
MSCHFSAMHKKEIKEKLKKRARSIYANRGAVIDKGAIYVVVVLTLLIFGSYVMVGGTLPTKLPGPNTQLVELLPPGPDPTGPGLQLHALIGSHPHPGPHPATGPNMRDSRSHSD